MSTNLPITFTDKVNNPAIKDAMSKFPENTYFPAEHINAFKKAINELHERSLSNPLFKGSINLASDAPISPGVFSVEESGTYVKYGGLVVDLSLGYTTISFDGVSFGKQVSGFDASGKVDKTDFDFLIDLEKNNIEELSPNYTGDFSSEANPFNTAYSNENSFFNNYIELAGFSIKSIINGNVTVFFVKINADKTYEILHSQVFSLIIGDNFISKNEVTKDLSGKYFNTHIFIKGSIRGIVKYAATGMNYLSIGDGATTVSNGSGLTVNVILSVLKQSKISTTVLNNKKRLDDILNENPNWDLETELLTKTKVIIPDGTHVINSNVIVPSGVTIIGNSKKSILQAGGTCTKVLDLSNSDDVTLVGFTLKGLFDNVDIGSSSLVANKSDVVNLTNIGDKNGIYLNNCKTIIIDNLTICNFSGSGLEATYIGNSFVNGCKFTNLNVKNNYIGTRFNTRAEYSIMSNSTINSNVIGTVMKSGNFILDCNIITANRVNLALLSGDNSGHGAAVGCLLNHAGLFGLIIDNVDTGFPFTSCSFFEAPIDIENSKGIIVNSCLIATTVNVNNGTDVKSNMFSNNTFLKSYGGGNVNILNNSKTLLKNNFYIDGSDNSLINN